MTELLKTTSKAASPKGSGPAIAGHPLRGASKVGLGARHVQQYQAGRCIDELPIVGCAADIEHPRLRRDPALTHKALHALAAEAPRERGDQLSHLSLWDMLQLVRLKTPGASFDRTS